MKSFEQENIPRPEYPRPQFVREDNWINLNGEWDFTFDDNNVGLREQWYKKECIGKFEKKIIVPFCFQSKLSGVEDTSFHEIVWYRKEFDIMDNLLNKKIYIHFGAVDYSCVVYLNGEHVGMHEGGYIGFSLDITDFLKDQNVLVMRVEDPSQDLEIPRGKQYWKEDIKIIFYHRVSGIWQTVWLEVLSSEHYVEKFKIVTDIDDSEIFIDFVIPGTGFPDLFLSIEIKFNGQLIIEEEINLDFLGKIGQRKPRKTIKERIDILQRKLFHGNPNSFKLKITIPKSSLHLWDVKSPNLYDLHMKILNKNTNEVYDDVKSYFGMRKISIADSKSPSTNNQILLNNEPLYQKLFLVQGYWPDGLYTAPSDEAIIKDIQYVKDFGFNGLRTHQKAFDPRFLYWCDKLGVLVWGEIGNAYQFSVNSQLNLLNEFVAEIERDFNHPSIIAWVPLNEGWGVSGADKDPKKGFYTLSLYYLIKSIDHTRLVVDDDGYYHLITDVLTRHFYSPPDLLPKTLDDEIESHDKAAPKLYLDPFSYKYEPIIYSEIGGYGYDLHKNIEEKWGYGGVIDSAEDFFEKVLDLLKEFDKRKNWIHGFCYTELYDQFQEINGLLSFNRVPKFPPSRLKDQLDKMFY